jgi:N-acetylglucosaminyl-diphospho-decaprenol L-rhamnosyltransferase
MCSNLPMIAVVVTTYSAPADTLDRCLRSIVASDDAAWVLVVDNGGHARIAADLADRVELLRTHENRGFGAAANVGFARANELGASAIALLNDDVVVESGWLAPLRAELDPTGRIGAVQPKLLIARTPDDAAAPQKPAVVNSVGVTLDRYGAGNDIGYGEPDGDAFQRTRDVELFTGGAVLFATEFLAATDGFDERFFMYYEDVDLGLRGHELGWTYRCNPSSRVWHEGGASANQIPVRRAYLQERNRLWCLVRFGDRRTGARGLWLTVRRVRHTPRLAHARALLGTLVAVPRLARERRAVPSLQHQDFV